MYLATVEARSDRHFPRSRVLMNATLMTPAGAVAVRIRDISVAGAQIWAESDVPTDCDAILKRGSFFAAARVVRRSEKNIGLHFYRKLSDEEFASAFEQKATRANVAWLMRPNLKPEAEVLDGLNPCPGR